MLRYDHFLEQRFDPTCVCCASACRRSTRLTSVVYAVYLPFPGIRELETFATRETILAVHTGSANDINNRQFAQSMAKKSDDSDVHTRVANTLCDADCFWA